MVFNWFRRQFGDRSQKPKVEEIEADQEQQAVESDPSEPEPESSQSEVAADYLTWAKAAYRNIQEQQQPQAETASEEIEESAEPVEMPVAEIVLPEIGVEPIPAETVEAQVTAKAVEAIPSAVVPEIVSEPIETPVTADIVETAPIATAITPDAVASPTDASADILVEQPTSSESLETTPSAAAPVPFWAQEDRQARLERLKATAIEETADVTAVQPDQSAVAIQTTVEEQADIALEEGFLWSARVLAAQGRRPEDISFEEISWLKRLRQGLDKTRRSLINQLKAIVGQGPLNQDAVMEIEALLLQADVGIEATDLIVQQLQQRLREEVLPPDQAIAYLKQILRDMLDRPFTEAYSPSFAPEKDTLNIWLMTGVNGAGKTTTIGKIAHLAQKSGYNCLIGAADTFRAAAVEQVKIWGQRSGTEVIANPGKNTDPAAVVFDAITAAQARNVELLLIDTAGRLQNKKNLMDELSKIRRIVDKKAPDAKVESLLVLDSTLGQNGLRQAQVFSEAAKLSGVVLTKLDGTAKGGVAIAVVQQLGLPIRFIGAGEGIEDLRPFSSYEFVEALLSG